MGTDALAEVGVGFSLFETPRLAALVTRVAAEEQAARRAARAAAMEQARPEEAALARGGHGDRLTAPPGGRPTRRTLNEPQARMRRRAISPSIWRSAST